MPTLVSTPGPEEVAAVLAGTYGDAVLVAHLAPPDAEPRGVESGPDGVDHLTVPVPDDPRGAAEVLLDRLRPFLRRYATVFLDRLSPALVEALARAGAPGPLVTPATGDAERRARTVSHRRVGVALGARPAAEHAALLEALAARGVPVDLLAGSGPGAVVAAYFAVLGADGLDLAVRRARLLSALALAPPLARRVVAADLGDALLERLSLALAFDAGGGEAITRGPIPAALVRALVPRPAPRALVAHLGADLVVAELADAERWANLSAPRGG